MDDSTDPSPEEALLLAKFREISRQAEAEALHFWQEEYPRYSRERKQTYWLAQIHRGMRTQGEAVGDPYTEFSPEWYADALAREPDFESIRQEIMPRMGFEFDESRFRSMIGIPEHG